MLPSAANDYMFHLQDMTSVEHAIKQFITLSSENY